MNTAVTSTQLTLKLIIYTEANKQTKPTRSWRVSLLMKLGMIPSRINFSSEVRHKWVCPKFKVYANLRTHYTNTSVYLVYRQKITKLNCSPYACVCAPISVCICIHASVITYIIKPTHEILVWQNSFQITYGRSQFAGIANDIISHGNWWNAKITSLTSL